MGAAAGAAVGAVEVSATEVGVGEAAVEDVGEAVLAQGLAAAAKPLRVLLGEILKGQP